MIAGVSVFNPPLGTGPDEGGERGCRGSMMVLFKGFVFADGNLWNKHKRCCGGRGSHRSQVLLGLWGSSVCLLQQIRRGDMQSNLLCFCLNEQLEMNDSFFSTAAGFMTTGGKMCRWRHGYRLSRLAKMPKKTYSTF